MIMMTLKLLTSLLYGHLLSTIASLRLGPFSYKTSPISKLPTEILIYILKNLHSPRDLRSCVLVSRRWCECAVELLWYKPDFPYYSCGLHYYNAISVKNMASLLGRQNQTFPYFRFIRELSIHGYLDDDVFSSFSRCENLEGLNISGHYEHLLTGECLAKVLPHFTNLVAINLLWVVSTTSESVIGLAKVATRLQNVNLGGSPKSPMMQS